MTIDSGRFDVLDVVHDRGENAFEAGREAAFHLFRIQSGELPGDSDYGNIDIRKDVRWRALDHHGARQQDQKREHDKGIRTIKCESDYPHMAIT